MIVPTLLLLQAAVPVGGSVSPPAPLISFEGQQGGAARTHLDDRLEDPKEFRLYWKDGIHAETHDKTVTFRIGGRIQWDSAFLGNNRRIERTLRTHRPKNNFALNDGTEFRRVRLYMSGTIDHLWEWKTQFDFVGNNTSFKDVYIGYKGDGYGVRVGQMKEPFSLEELTSSNYMTFMERSLPNVFSPGRSTGVLVHGNVQKRVAWGAGIFKDSNNQGLQKSDGNLNFTARVAGSPVFKDEGKQVVHVGLSGSYRQPNNNTLRLRERPESHISPRFVDTGTFGAQGEALVGAEAAFVWDRASLQAEFMHDSIDVLPRGDVTLKGWYVEASWFLTDDHRIYDPASGTFKGVKPSRKVFNKEDGLGALEFKARLSGLDLSEGPVAGGELKDLTLGLNWYLNNNMRVMFEVIRADLDMVGRTTIAQVRFQINT